MMFNVFANDRKKWLIGDGKRGFKHHSSNQSIYQRKKPRKNMLNLLTYLNKKNVCYIIIIILNYYHLYLFVYYIYMYLSVKHNK